MLQLLELIHRAPRFTSNIKQVFENAELIIENVPEWLALKQSVWEEMIKQGCLGEKSGKGFYTYPNPAYLQKGWLRKETNS